MQRLPALHAALLLTTTQPLLLGTVVSVGTLLLARAPAQAQNAEAVAKIAETIAVRLEGATQGSGVLVKREGNRYTVLTAWHVVGGQRPGEELDIYTSDGQRHKLEQGSIKRLGEVDMAVLSFSSPNSYEVARVGDVKSVSSGSGIYVAGFPLPSSAVPTRIWRFLKGEVIANATVAIPNGYQLLYSNQTLPGMSGGAVMNAQGRLVGIHGQGETDSKMSEQQGVAVKTGTNQAVPIGYYSQYSAGAVAVSYNQASTADDYLAQAYALGNRSNIALNLQAFNDLVRKSLKIKPTALGYLYSSFSRDLSGDRDGEIADLTSAISLDPGPGNAYLMRAAAMSKKGIKKEAIMDLTKASLSNDTKEYYIVYYNRCLIKAELGDFRGALSDYNRAIALRPGDSEIYVARAISKDQLGDTVGAIGDFDRAIKINPLDPDAFIGRGLANLLIGNRKGCQDIDFASRNLSYRHALELYSEICSR